MKLSLPGLLKTFVVFFVFLVAFAGCEAEVSDGDDYSEKRITITYVDESGNILKTDSQTSYGSVWLSYIKTGYVCTYYDSNGKKIETKYNYKTESDCKIIVKFTPIKYTIKFEKNHHIQFLWKELFLIPLNVFMIRNMFCLKMN